MKYERWLNDLWNGDLASLEEIAREVVSPDFVGNWPGRPGFALGPDSLAAIIRQGREMFDDLTFSIAVGPIASGDLIAARWVGRGHLSGTPAEFHGHDLLRHADGRFTEYWVIAEDPTG
ncbi:ester cyclase [Amycolatopsis anabasis]|uniref:ester cyclase n=1 Tax=Amycolatopsis anabasis TaxID=1840409 RepID=UPI00131D49CE|nr:nuclear transport factor 2 family protein [Amycolatopsis anabasis]